MEQENEETNQLFNQLVDYLKISNTTLQHNALQIILQYCDDHTFLNTFSEESERKSFVRQLLRLIGGDKHVSEKAAECLVNLSAHPKFASQILSVKGIDRLMDNLRDQIRGDAFDHKSLNLMIISNLTRDENGIKSLLGVENVLTPHSGLHISKLITYFTSNIGKSKDQDDYFWVAHTLVNISTIEVGREFIKLLDPKIINSLCLQMKYIHRGEILCDFFRHICCSPELHTTLIDNGFEIVHTLLGYLYTQPVKHRNERNLNTFLFDKEYTQEANEEVEYSKDITQNRILSSLVNYAQFDNNIFTNTQPNQICGIHPIIKNEQTQSTHFDIGMKMALMECIFGFCTSYEGRQFLRKCGAFEVMSALYAINDLPNEFRQEINRLSQSLEFPEEINVNKLINLSELYNY